MRYLVDVRIVEYADLLHVGDDSKKVLATNIEDSDNTLYRNALTCSWRLVQHFVGRLHTNLR